MTPRSRSCDAQYLAIVASNERTRQAQILDRYIEAWGPICSGYDEIPHFIRPGNRLIVVEDAGEDEANILCLRCIGKRGDTDGDASD